MAIVATQRKVIGISILAELAFLLISIMFTGAGHGTYFPAILFFPYVMIPWLLDHLLPIPLVILTLIQYPVYGIIISVAMRINKLQAVQTILIALHGLAIVSAFVCANIAGRYIK